MHNSLLRFKQNISQYLQTQFFLQDCTEEPKCTVYEHDFSGRALQFTEDILDLRWYKMNDKASSIRVHSGA